MNFGQLRYVSLLDTKPSVSKYWSVLLALLVTAAPTLAQTPRASVRGIVVDQTGARVPGAQVRVIDVATNTTRSIYTDAEGRFALAELSAAAWQTAPSGA